MSYQSTDLIGNGVRTKCANLIDFLDYPFAWPPHQIMAWVGLERYGFLDDSARLAYRWVYM